MFVDSILSLLIDFGMKEEEEANSRYYVGIDLSTQAIKVTVLNSIFELVYETSCPFETTFPQYRFSFY